MSLKILSNGECISLVVTLVIVAISLIVYNWWQTNRRYYELGSKIPGPPALPIIGNAHIVLGKSHNEVLEGAIQFGYEYGNVIRGWLGPKLFIFLSHPEDVEVILSSNVCLEKSDDYRFFKPWLGNGLLISSGEHWRNHRKMIAPTFHKNILRTFVEFFYNNALNAVNRLEKEIGEEFDVHDIMSETTVDILLETVMGIKRTTQSNKGYEYAMAVMKMCDIIHKRTYNALYRWDRFYKLTKMRENEKKLLATIHELTAKVIQKKNKDYDKLLKSDGKGVSGPSFAEIIAEKYSNKSAPAPAPAPAPDLCGLRDDLDDIDENDIGGKRRLAFLDLMVETAKTGGNLTDEEIRDEVNTIMFEGHDTTAAGSSFTLCLLGVYQRIQEKVYEELHGIFGDSNRAPTFADTVEMKYLERVILESLRLYPPVPGIARKLTQEVKCATENYILPKGCTVVIGTYMIHRRPEFYPNPNQFNPDNFLPENSQKRHYYSFIPFSAGPRSCVGRKYAMLKLKILLSTILRNFKIKSNVKESDFKLQADIILKRADGFRIELERRRK